MSFVHLHVHSQYSILDGALSIKDLVGACKNLNMEAAALTDHGNMFGAMDFYFKARSAGIKPILGCELYLTSGSRFEKSKTGQGLHHLTVLCKNVQGYKNLCELVTKGFKEGFYYKPRIDFELLEKCYEGLIVLSGCPRGQIPMAITDKRIEDAKDLIRRYQNIFKDDFYLEVQNHHLDFEKTIRTELRKLSKEFSIPTVATNDVHYLSESHAAAHDVLLCLQTQRNLDDPNRMRFSNNEFYFKSREEMEKLFEKEELDITLEIAKKCNCELKLTDEKGRTVYHLPSFEVEGTLEDYFIERCKKGLEKRISENAIENIEEYKKRLDDEIAMILKTGFVGYFLVVSDFVTWAKEQGIPVGPGRGSGAGSLVAWSLQITDLDPIFYGLLFERFINPERISLPDFDIDFCMDRRSEVIDYVTKKYGEDKVCQIITFGKMLARGVLRDVGRVYAVPYAEMDQVAKLIPEELGIELEEAFEKEPEILKSAEGNPKLKKVFDTALKLEGSIKNVGKHAAGLIITNKPLVEYLPLYVGKEGELTTQFDKDLSEMIGLVKFDFLGLKTLTQIEQASQMIRKKKNPEFHIAKVNKLDEKTFALISKGDCHGVFQLESSGMADVCTKIRPKSIKDISVLSALYRPGPIGAGLVDDYIDRVHGRKKVEYIFPELEEDLKETLGVIVYQEQVMKIARIVAGYSLGEADILRRAMGKKKPEEMAKQKEKFINGGIKNKFPKDSLEELFDMLAEFANYGFNKSHSCAYGELSFQTAYLKTHYPEEFYAALLTTELDDIDKLTKYIEDAKKRGIKVLPPHVNMSGVMFDVSDENAIVFGLSAVKGVGQKAALAIVEERIKNGPYEDIFDFESRISSYSVNKKALESLILVGAFSGLGEFNRQTLVTNLDVISKFGSEVGESQKSGQESLFSHMKLKLTPPKLKEIPEYSKEELLRVEKELIGFYVSGHPLENYLGLMNDLNLMTLTKFKEQAPIDLQKASAQPKSFGNPNLRDKKLYKLGAMFSLVKYVFTKKGDKMAIVTLETLEGNIQGVVFPKSFEKYQEFVRQGELVMVAVEANIQEDQLKVIVQDITPLKDCTVSLSKRIVVQADEKELTEKFITSLKEFCAHYPGQNQLTLKVKSELGTAQFTLQEKIDASGRALGALSSIIKGECTIEALT